MTSKEYKYQLEKLNWLAKNGRVPERNLRNFNNEVLLTNLKHNDAYSKEKESRSSDEFKEGIMQGVTELARKLRR